jgi:hypothetical protein
VSTNGPNVSVLRPVTVVHGSKWPISNWVLMLYGPNPQGTMFAAFAVEYEGWKLNGAPLQSAKLVFLNPLAAEAIILPRRPFVRSFSVISSACPPRTLASNMWMTIRSPWFIMSVCASGVTDARSDSCGLGGPVGTPFVWMKAKLTGSMQLLLHVPPASHSTLSMVSAEHQCVLSQLIESANGANPGG